jgi:hypothetical protein
VRYHTGDSIQIKYDDNRERLLDKAAFSLTGNMGCEHGGGVSCAGNSAKGPKQSFLGYMFYNRLWFDNDEYGLTLGGGQINNPGRYLVLLPSINGATATSGTPHFTENPGDPYKACLERLTGCRANTLLSAGSTTIAQQMYPTFPGPEALRYHAATMARRDRWSASAASRPATVRQ